MSEPKCHLCGETDPMNFERCEHCGNLFCDDCCDWCENPDDEMDGVTLCVDCQFDDDGNVINEVTQ